MASWPSGRHQPPLFSASSPYTTSPPGVGVPGDASSPPPPEELPPPPPQAATTSAAPTTAAVAMVQRVPFER
ncbi:MAG: hypothetical protein ACKO04_10810 [Actinomycetes bacterium]